MLDDMRILTLVLFIAGLLSACGDVAIGPVDHSCPTDRSRGQGSGCSEGRG
jgi:hypothetical protein